MNWLNLNIQTLDSENFLGSDPIERGTWLCLLRYCIGQENGGIIEGCREWGDRKWQQLVRVTKKEAMRDCDLWEWDGDDLILWGYPMEKEEEIKHLRAIGRQTSDAKKAAAKANGKRGGRPTKNPTENPTETEQETQTKPIERKGKEIEGEGEVETRSPSPSFAEVQRFANSQPIPIPPACIERFFDEMESTEWTYRGQPCIAPRAWHARFRMYATRWAENERKMTV
jgi:hypothetical protein